MAQIVKAEMDEMIEDIVATQTEQPWLVSKEARVPQRASISTHDETQQDAYTQQEAINRQLKESFERNGHSSSGKNGKRISILEQRRRLPAYAMKDDIVAKISQHQISLVAGSTGCGR